MFDEEVSASFLIFLFSELFPRLYFALLPTDLFFLKQTIRSLAAYFGRLERFSPYQIGEDTDGMWKRYSIQPTKSKTQDSEQENTKETRQLYPAPHDAPRSPSMDARCWEIKWDHRDDCVSALMVCESNALLRTFV